MTMKDNWIEADSRKPEAGQRVLIAYYDDRGRPMVTIGWYAPRWTIQTSDFADEVDDEYSDELDDYYIREGWVDESVESEFHYRIRYVTHWQPLALHPDLNTGNRTLAPCPNCGSHSVGLITRLRQYGGLPNKKWRTQCKACGAQRATWYSDSNEAITDWNQGSSDLRTRWDGLLKEGCHD